MYNDHITVQFTHQEKWELQKCMHFISASTDAKFSQNKNNSERLKEDIVEYVRQSQKKMEEHARVMELVKDLFIEKKVYPKRGKDYHYEMKKDEVYDCIKKLKILLSEKDRDSQCCTIYSNIMNELSSLTPEKLPSFDKNVNQSYKIMSYQQRDNISKVAHNLIKAGQSERKLHIVEQVSSFFTKINRYGTNEEYPQLSKIENEELRQKMIKMVEQLKQNYVEIEPIYYYRDQSIKDFINKLSNNLYSKEQMKKRMNYLNPKVQSLFDPLFNQLYRLRQSSDSTERSMQYSSSQRSFASNKDGRSSHQDGIGQVISDLAEYKKKNDQLTNQIKELKWFISIVNYRGASEDRQIVKEVKSFIAKYKSQDMGRELEKLYEGKKQVQPRQLAFKKKNRVFQDNLSEEKLHNEIFILKAEVVKLKEENDILNHKTYENIDERIQLLNKLQTLQSEKNNEEDRRIKNEQDKQLRILDIEMRLKQTQKKYEESENDLGSLRFSSNELSMLLQQKQKELARIREQGLLYEKTIVDLQNEQTAKLIEEENMLDKNNRVEELENELIYQKAKVDQKTERIDELQLYLTVKVNEIRQEKDEQLRIQKQAKDEEINFLKNKIGQLQGRQTKQESIDLSHQVFELATRNQQFALQIQMLISAKDLALKSSIKVAQGTYLTKIEKEKVETELSDVKEKFYFANIEKQQLQEETRKLRSQMINFNKTKYEELILKNQQLELKGKQYLQSNINLKRQMNELLANQILQKDMSKSQKGISMEEYQNMQNEMLQMNKITLMIRDQYKKFKNQMNNVVKHKIQVEKSVFKANQTKLRDNYEQARDNFFVLQEKVDALEKENLGLKQDKQNLIQENNKMNKVEAHNFSFSREKEQKDYQIASLTQKYQTLQNESETELNRKDEQLSDLKLEILQLKNELESTQNLIHQNSILQQRMRYMQEEIEQYCQNISFYKQEIQQKDQQIITLKIDVLESQVEN